MTIAVTMTPRGRFTLPKKLQGQLGLVPCARLAFSLLSYESIALRVKNRRSPAW